ncbi:MAG: helix-turn-helix transcriptional regulator [Maribacter sp.]|nr:helix-turn-helix transcriptional regulator [Maribacter sp.]
MKNKDLAKKIKELRKRSGISQELLAENSGLSLRTIQRIENGETQPTGDSIKRLSSALNVT